MTGVYLTQHNGKIIGPVAKLLGYLMQGIYYCLDQMHIGNTGLAIIIFTIIIYLLLMPLTVKQQKFSKLQARMNPELQAIQAKYKGKSDNASQMALQEETKAVYAKYGVSPTGSCVQLLIQMPILFALYRVIYALPAYVPSLKAKFIPAVDAVIENGDSGLEALKSLSSYSTFAKQFESEAFLTAFHGDAASADLDLVKNSIVDVLNRASTSDWDTLASSLSSNAETINSTKNVVSHLNNFGVLNIGNNPWSTITDSFASHSYFVLLCALLVPILAAVTQYVNAKLAPGANTDDSSMQDNPMAASMKSMTTIMPLMSAFISFTLPIGMGIYWIAGAVVRSVQQVLINKHIDKMNIDDIIEQNADKAKAKMAKYSENQQKLQNYANMKTKSVSQEAAKAKRPERTQEERDAALKKASEYYKKSAAKPGSLTAKANMVRDYDNKKK